MPRFSELRELIDEAEKAYHQRGIGRQMIMRAGSILSKIEQSDKKMPAWVKKEIARVREALTYENYEDA